MELRRYRPHPYRPAKVLAEPRTILDVGAADGTPELYTAFADAFIVAFEPLPEQLPRLRAGLETRSHQIIGVAVGSSDGTLDLAVDAINPLKSSFHPRTTFTRSAEHCVRRTVPVRTLDGLVSAGGWVPPYVLKVDTEGHELDVLKAATRTLERTVALYCETTVGQRFDGGYTFSEVAGFLIAQGFELVDLLAAPRGGDGRTLFVDAVWVPRSYPSACS